MSHIRPDLPLEDAVQASFAVPAVEIYTKSWCTYCHRAKELLNARGIVFVEHDVTRDPILEAEMRNRSGRTTVPQVFVNGQSIGGATDLIALDYSGDLAALIAGDCQLPEDCATPVAYGDRDAFRAAVNGGAASGLSRVAEVAVATFLTGIVFSMTIAMGLVTSGIIEF